MKYLLLILICFTATAQQYADVGIDNAKINGGDRNPYYNAEVDQLNDNSWRFTSNTNNDRCVAVDGEWQDWNCKRADVQLVEWYQKEATMRYSFYLTVEKYPSWPSPYWMIVLQDWRKSNVRDSLGRHPITTLKLKNYNGLLYIGHFDNSWQWEYEFPENDPTDTNHSIPSYRGCWGAAPTPTDGVHHQENTCNGVARIIKGTPHFIELIISQNHASMIVDGYVITDVEYKTKSNLEWSFIKWGMYWDKNYNTSNDPAMRTIYTIEDFKRSILTKE